MNGSFLKLYLAAFLHPGAVFEEIIHDPKKVFRGALAVCIPATVYTFVYIFLIMGGGQPFKPWLNIPLESYYQYNVFFCAPSMFLGWILAAGVVHVLCRFITDSGQFEQILCLLGYGIGMASWATGLHDLVTSFLGAIHIIDQHQYEGLLNTPTFWQKLLWVQMGLYLIWFLLLFTLGVQKTYTVSKWAAVLLGTAGFVVYQGFFLIFNR